MRRADVIDLILIAAIWGSSFLFIRMAVPDFGPIALSGLRTLAGGLLLLPLLFLQGKLGLLRAHWAGIVVVGMFNSAIPFVLFNYATISIPSGTMSIINALTPLWGAAVAWLWLKDVLPPARLLGLIVGFTGIVVLVWDKLSLGATGSLLAVLAGVAAPSFYGVAASYTKKYLMGADPIAAATGSLIAAGIALLPLTWYTWLAYVMYYRLLMRIGPSKALTCSFLIPVFGVLWGWLWLDEEVTLNVVLGGGVILLGTALATGLLGGKKSARKPSVDRA
jgi:drug/metabolite transporter (DMT)-like permease